LRALPKSGNNVLTADHADGADATNQQTRK
jgi:hypothetical protein